jgi:hypothetical protein
MSRAKICVGAIIAAFFIKFSHEITSLEAIVKCNVVCSEGSKRGI